MPSRSRFDVVIFCALREEFEALKSVKLGLSQPGWVSSKDRGWSFSDCRFTTEVGQDISVRATWLPEMGPEQASSVAGLILSRFPAKMTAMSGICAGRRGYVALGDVILGTAMWSYDAGKRTIENGKSVFRAKMLQYRPASNVVQCMKSFDAPNGEWMGLRPVKTLEEQEFWYLRQSAKDPSVLLSASLRRYCPDWSEYVYDRLVRRKWINLRAELTELGKNVALEHSTKFPSGKISTNPFRVFAGPIATGATVVEDEGIFPKLSHSMRDVLGIDMESSALAALAEAHSIPVIVAKGVSDHGDRFKDDRYRIFAARASAEVLLAFVRRHFDDIVGNQSVSRQSDDVSDRSYAEFFRNFKGGYLR